MDLKYCVKCMREIRSGNVCPVCGEVEAGVLAPHVLLPGTMLKGRYLIGKTLGQGGFGITYISLDTLLKVRVAIKEYYPSSISVRNTERSASVIPMSEAVTKSYESGRSKFLEEARLLAAFRENSGIVNVQDYFDENNTSYIVMEYIDGVTLRQMIKNNHVISPKLTLELLLPVMESLQFIHENGMIHRDVSPDNIMIKTDGSMHLMDFGAAREFDADNPQSMSVIYKPGYAPVEQHSVHGQQGPWTDVYALCATIYVCLTGITPPYSMTRMFNDEIKWPRELGVSISEEFEEILKKGLSIEWDRRHRSVRELMEEIAKVSVETPNQSQPLAETTVSIGYVSDLKDRVHSVIDEQIQASHDEQGSRMEYDPYYIKTTRSIGVIILTEDNKVKNPTTAEEGSDETQSSAGAEEGVSHSEEQIESTHGAESKGTNKLLVAVACLAGVLSISLMILVGILLTRPQAGKKAEEQPVEQASSKPQEPSVEQVGSASQDQAEEPEESESQETPAESEAQEPQAEDTAEKNNDGAEETDIITKEEYKKVSIGDTVTLGDYNGNTEWTVLAKEDDRMLIISKYAIEQRQYNSAFELTTWEKSSIRAWLNDEYLHAAFSAAQQEQILSKSSQNNDNQRFGTDGGNDTTDQVFLLSIDEAKKYFASNDDRRATLSDGTSVWWWLCSPGNGNESAAYVDDDGSVDTLGYSVNNEGGAVRPAMWIDISNH